MRYLKFRNILILLEVQEIDWLPSKNKNIKLKKRKKKKRKK